MDLSKLILEAVKKREREAPRNYIGCSTIGNPCNRAIWYAYHNAPCEPIRPQIQVIFDTGRYLENLIINYLEEAGVNLIRPSDENHNLFCFDENNPKFRGHMDGIIFVGSSPCVLEIKTMKSSEFENFKRKGLFESHPKYYAQIQAYIGMKQYKSGVLLAMNKDTQAFHHEWVEGDSDYYAVLKAKAEIVGNSNNPPERITGYPLGYTCSRCNYKKICFQGELEHE